MPGAGQDDQFVVDAGVLQRGADLLPLGRVDQRVVLADEVKEPARDSRRQAERRGRPAQRISVVGSQPPYSTAVRLMGNRQAAR